ncbi:antibiotic biosynthesis monooxygenase [Roseomonas sp. NAR14]|uniref:Antibiotic biosynthesis monooxygenase n=1 Tax=Roseomonas acroporae TaxID=2937791 RepID=A0A9X1Y9Y6_9PROT|nr:antibiotic biosynthesis monooxygenase [Roseomonas acroporae]MCK8785558.1 antibiotic biosynthesis monooxygenase [Roseomonas acroporae]
MRLLRLATLCLVLFLCGGRGGPPVGAALAQAPSWQAPEGQREFSVTYVEFLPGRGEAGAAALRRLAEAGMSLPGAIGVAAARETGRPEFFTLIEAWRSAGDARAARDDAAREAARAALGPLLAVPLDERVGMPLAGGLGAAAWQPGRFAVVTHVDIMPPGAPATRALLDRYLPAVRAEPGAAGIALLSWRALPNHWQLVEVFRDAAAYDAHVAAAHTMGMRAAMLGLQPYVGAPYDSRRHLIVFALGSPPGE